ncbi:MAG: 3-dehydroquinate synthase [Candidatus Pelagibacter sp.]|nr:3-dehydroquinate synthase [Candidatus Pelagibacter sp.]OUV88551.1 MAG: 3-dehydroquinate synthase [Pelagibacteraceae bacterium TMED136]|tara:strand:+ start:6274 stop:7386 length:1113 start_codon:yes stop_codon:yes gene_type:complete
MKTLFVKTKVKNYPIFIGHNIFNKFRKYQKVYLKNTNNILVVSTKKIPEKYLVKLKKNIKGVKTYTVILPDGEKIKNNNYVVQITDLLSKYNFNRNDCIISIGGGVVGDLSGYVASIYKRGINLVQIPTTLLSQVDSAVGGKTGINNNYGKNIIGTFYQPNFVLIDSVTLSTLPKREMSAGFAEILKYSLILDKKFFNWLCLKGNLILKKRSKNEILIAIHKSCTYKAGVVKKDEFENSHRAILNFGHTFAHAIETASNYSKKIIHGEAVLIGMMLASRLSNRLGYLKNKDLKDIKDIYKKLGLNFKYKKFVTNKNKNNIFKIMINDKKSLGEKIKIILLKKIGVSFIKETTLKNSFIPLILKDIKNGHY